MPRLPHGASATRLVLLGVLGLAVAGAVVAQPQRPGGGRPARDLGPPAAEPAGTASITGSVVAADTGQPVPHAYLRASSGTLRGGRATVTDADGRYQLNGLPAGRYTITASETDFVSVSYGQRRVLESGTPLEIADGETLKKVDLALPRGSVITGQVVDEVGEPLAGVSVRAMRHEYRQGERRLTIVGTDTSDDRGQYRVYGLAPGTYYVSAVARFIDSGRGFRRGFGRGTQLVEQDMGYAPTYYPGVTTGAQAVPLVLGVSEETTGISFGVMLVPTVRVAGVVLSPSGAPMSRAAVSLVPDGAGQAVGGTLLNAQTQADGAFTVRNVLPGRYLVVARSGGRRVANPLFAMQSITVDGQEIGGLIMMLAAGATVTGTVVFESSTLPPDNDLSRVRVSTRALRALPFGGDTRAGVEPDGTFELTNVPIGAQLFQVDAPDPWILKAVYVNGQDVTDVPLEFIARSEVEAVIVVLTDQVSELSGLVSDGSARPLPEFTVVAFSTDTALWRSQSRQIAVGRPDQNGRYQARGLPPGDHYVVAVDGIEQGSWYDPTFLGQLSRDAVRVSVRDGELNTLDLHIDVPSR